MKRIMNVLSKILFSHRHHNYMLKYFKSNIAITYKAFRNYRLKVTDYPVPISSKNVIPAKFLIGTGNGIYLYDHGILKHLLLPGASVRGLTYYRDRWYAARGLRPYWYSDLISFSLGVSQAQNIRREKRIWGSYLHQIDVADDKLFVTDPSLHSKNNQLTNHVRVYRLKENELVDDGIIHVSASSKGINPHVNSVLKRHNKIYVMCHNKTHLTGEPSEIRIYNEKYDLLDVMSLPAGDCHNIAFFKGKLLYNDSLNATFSFGEDRINLRQTEFDNEANYLRGLAISEDLILFGGSARAPRHKRDSNSGAIYAFDPINRKIMFRIEIPNSGGISEIRFLDRLDHGRSMSSVFNDAGEGKAGDKRGINIGADPEIT